MISNPLFSKLLKEELKRKTWAIALLGLVMFFTLPVAAALLLSTIQSDPYNPQNKHRITESFLRLVSWGENYAAVPFVLLLFAMIFGISAFAYLHNRKQVDFYHSLPAKRGLFYVVNVSAGILAPAVVYGMSLVFALIVGAVNEVDLRSVIGPAVRAYGLNLLFYCLTYFTVILAMMLTGKKLIAVFGSLVFFAYFPSLYWLINGFCSRWFFSYSALFKRPALDFMSRLSPVSALIGAWNTPFTTTALLIILLAVLLLFWAGLFLYQERRLEAAEQAMAFRWSQPIIKILLVGAFGMAGALFFDIIGEYTVGWAVFGMLAGILISHCVIEIIYHSDFRKLFADKKTLVGCMAAGLALLCSFAFDWFGYDEYLPKADHIARAVVSIPLEEWADSYDPQDIEEKYWGGYDRYEKTVKMNIRDAETVLAIAREGIAHENFTARESSVLQPENQFSLVGRVEIGYVLKSGRKIARSYVLNFANIEQEMARLYQNEDYKKAYFPVLSADPKLLTQHMNYQDQSKTIQYLAGTTEQKIKVAEAYQQDLAALTWQERVAESPIGEILFIPDELGQEMLARYVKGEYASPYSNYNFSDYYYPVYQSFTRTQAALLECGIDLAGEMKPENIQEITVRIYRETIDEQARKAGVADSIAVQHQELRRTYTEQEEITAILAGFVPDTVRHHSVLQHCNNDYRVEIKFFSNKLNTVSGSLFADQIPAFLELQAEKQ